MRSAIAYVVVPAALALTACMTSPGNGEKVCGGDQVVDFTGYALAANHEVTIETSASPTGPFVALARVRSGDEPVKLSDRDATKLYPWKASARIPTWSTPRSLQGTKQSYVRVSQSHVVEGTRRTLYSYTFDEGAPYVGCINDAIGDGKTARAAADKCKSASSPVARVDAPAISTCAPKKRPWERACKSEGRSWVSKRFLVGLRAPLRCEEVPGNLGWTVARVVDAIPHVCTFEWSRTWAMTNEDRAVLESYAATRDDWDRGRTEDQGYPRGSDAYLNEPDIDPDCAPSRSTCKASSCAKEIGKPLPDRTAPTGFRDLASGCPKCVAVSEGQLFLTVPPEYAAMDKLSVTHEDSQEVLRVAPNGQQVFRVEPKGGDGSPLTLERVFQDAFGAERPIRNDTRFVVTPGHWYVNRSGTVPPGE